MFRVFKELTPGGEAVLVSEKATLTSAKKAANDPAFSYFIEEATDSGSVIVYVKPLAEVTDEPSDPV